MCARAAADALQRFDNAEVAQSINDFEVIAARQQRSPSLTGMMEKIVTDNKEGRHSAALQTIDAARRAFSARPNQSFLDHQAATAHLRLRNYEEAADAIERILAAESGAHMAYAFHSIYSALNTGLDRAKPHWRRSLSAQRLSRLQAEIRQRLQ